MTDGGKRQTFILGMGLTLILGLVALWLSPLPGLSIMGSLTIALLLGVTWRAAVGLPKTYVGGVQFSAKKLLRYAIILTGVRLNFGLIASSGLQVLVLDATLIVFGLLFIPWLARKAGLPAGLALLIGVGQSICGASAVMAAASVTPDADDKDASLAVGICGLIGTAGVLLFAISFNLFHLDPHFYALLSGSTLHEIAQVAAAGPVGGLAAADLALVVKLTRVVLLAPVIVTLALLFSARSSKQNGTGYKLNLKNLPLPWFVFGFLLVGALNSTGLFPKELANAILTVATFLFVMSMAGMGLMLDLAAIRRTGLKALSVAILAFAIFITVSLVLTNLLF